jgi:hypothetical protein
MLSESKSIALAELVTTVESRFPVVMYKGGGSRAQEAARIIEMDEIAYIGESYGVDYYRSHGHTTSVKGGGCTCGDILTVEEKKFCKHRLAAMFMVKLNGHPESKLTKLLADATSDELTLRVYVLHTVDGDKYRMDGHRYGGQSWVKYERDDCWDFTQKQFDEAVLKAGWALTQRPVKQPSMYFHYFMARSTASVYALASVHAEALERHLQNKRFEEIRGVEEENEVFTALPESLQNAIKENLYAH